MSGSPRCAALNAVSDSSARSPTQAEIGKYYPSTFYEYFTDENNRGFHENRYQLQASLVERHLLPGPASRTLLDVGCAKARFMTKRGSRRYGIVTYVARRRPA